MKALEDINLVVRSDIVISETFFHLIPFDPNLTSTAPSHGGIKIPPGSILGHLPTTNAPPNDNTTRPSHGVITHNASTHTESSSSTGQAGQSSNHHNKGGNQGQVSGSIEGSSNKGSSNGDTNDKSKSNSKDNSGH